jgi:protoheme IX farnesyltransferase
MFDDRRPRVTSWLVAATFGVYLLVVVGATASLADAAAACSNWPLCTGALSDPVVLIALGHHLMAVLVGLVVLGAAVAVVLASTTRRVQLATLGALVLYPVQAGLGAYLATAGSLVPGLHLLAGVCIFAALLGALSWQLEHETGDADDSPPEAVDPDPEPSEPAEEPNVTRPASVSLRTRLGAYFRLTKPRLMWLLSLVAAAAMALAAGLGHALSVSTILLTLGGGVLAIGASGTFNNVLERDRDRRMSRTNDRPLVRHQVPARNALLFGVALAGLSLVVFLQLNALAAALGLTAILFYSVVYTLVLKPNTVQNTVIGGAAGSLPAHFYNLALAYKDDYARGGFPMMPVVRGETTTRKHILWWLGATFVATAALIWVTPLGWPTALVAMTVGAAFLGAVVRLHRERTEAAALRSFHASNAYLGALLLAVVLDSMVV